MRGYQETQQFNSKEDDKDEEVGKKSGKRGRLV